jgi:hypothetical protein
MCERERKKTTQVAALFMQKFYVTWCFIASATGQTWGVEEHPTLASLVV